MFGQYSMCFLISFPNKAKMSMMDQTIAGLAFNS